MGIIIIFILATVPKFPCSSHGLYLQNQDCEIALHKTQLTYSFFTPQIDSHPQQRDPAFGTICLEWLGGTTGGIGLGVLVACTYTWMNNRFNWYTEHPTSYITDAFFFGHLIGYTFGSALGASVTGKLLRQRGSFLASLVWSIGGEIISWGIGWTLGPSPFPYIFIIPQSFAVIGFNLRGKTCCGIGAKELDDGGNICGRYGNISTRNSVLKIELVKVRF